MISYNTRSTTKKAQLNIVFLEVEYHVIFHDLYSFHSGYTNILLYNFFIFFKLFSIIKYFQQQPLESFNKVK